MSAIAGVPMASDNKFPAYVVVKPGVNPDSINVEVEVVKLSYAFADMSDQALIDLAEEVDLSLKALAKWNTTAREILKERLTKPQQAGDTVITNGVRFAAHYAMKARVAIDQEAVRTEMGDQWWADHCKRTEFYELRIRPIGAAEQA